MTGATGMRAIMGGAFDPVHYGHLRTAVELREALGLATLSLVPSSDPPHRPAHFASSDRRLELLEAATVDMPWCNIDGRELLRAGPSWSVISLEELRAESGDHSLCMILGMDAFLGLPKWHRWEELLGLAHLVVAHRPGWHPPTKGELGPLLEACSTSNIDDLHNKPAGHIYIQEVTQLEISSSAIRALLAAGRDPRYLLPDSVLSLINASGCYTGGRDQ